MMWSDHSAAPGFWGLKHFFLSGLPPTCSSLTSRVGTNSRPGACRSPGGGTKSADVAVAHKLGVILHRILIAAMVENPILIERPVLLANGTVALGRPPEAVLDIL